MTKEKINEPKLELEKVATTLEQSESENTELKEQVSPTKEKLEQQEKKQEDLDVNLKNLQDELREAEEKLEKRVQDLEQELGLSASETEIEQLSSKITDLTST
ncbi:hypothetical protein Tco_0776280 [Tanacetum coccineum]